MKAIDDLQAAFAGESQANRKYLAFAKKAEADGFPQVAKLFRAAAAAETVHAHAHLQVLGGVKSTADNVAAAIAGETYEATTMYPEFIADAQAEKNAAASRSFTLALAVEKIHAGMYQKALESVKTGKDLAPVKYYICEVCGNTVEGAAPDKCSVCGAVKSKFSEVA